MKVLLLTVLLLLLCSTHVLTLRCYTCENETDDICKTEKQCDPSAQFCKTVTTDDKVYRTCEELCDEDYATNCCETDLC